MLVNLLDKSMENSISNWYLKFVKYMIIMIIMVICSIRMMANITPTYITITWNNLNIWVDTFIVAAKFMMLFRMQR
jgi:hypothetical protein